MAQQCSFQIIIKVLIGQNMLTSNIWWLESVKERQTNIEHINAKPMIANTLTRGLTPKVFKTHVANMSIVETFDVFG